MSTFADNKIISTAGGDDNGDFLLEFPTPGTYEVTIGGTFGSRSLELLRIDAEGNEFAIDDPDGVAMDAVVTNTVFIIEGPGLTIRMTGTDTALISCHATKIYN